jgi:hypothetical protein
MLAKIGLGSDGTPPPSGPPPGPPSGTRAGPPYAPYANAATDALYNLIFCDDPAAFSPAAGQAPTDWQRTLFAEPPNAAALRALADDATQEGRVRYIACATLRALGQPVPAKLLCGVVVEVPLDSGLDVLAAFPEGGVRYLNQTGHSTVFEGVDALGPLVQALFAVSQPVVERIGPWEQARRPPPAAGNVRLNFLASEGLCFGEGGMAVMQRDALAGPVIQRATALLQAVVSMRRT